MGSLRLRLFAVLIAATGAVWLLGAGWIYVGARQEVEQVLDLRLQEAARMVSSLVTSSDVAGAGGSPALDPRSSAFVGYERQLSCQIWSLDNRLVGRSSGAPDQKLSDAGTGFSERIVDGELWRVYAVEDEAKGVRVLVGDRLSLRERLVTDLIKGLLWPAALILPFLGLLIWVSVGRGLRPLGRIAGELSRRDAEDMSPVDAGAAPSEIRPLVGALNDLFGKVERARRHEREVTAFAAHELRTPLAGLKTQAQIAAAAKDERVRSNALRQVVRAVDRTSRLVSQLLALARLDAVGASAAAEDIELGRAIDEAMELCGPVGGDVVVTIAPELRTTEVQAPRECLTLLLRNLAENALEHTRPGGAVHWRLAADGAALELVDDGPGIPESELPLVTQRFFRGAARTSRGEGTGLGLAIAVAAAESSYAKLELVNRSDRSGLIARIMFKRGASALSIAKAA